jgi:hypothetical protein
LRTPCNVAFAGADGEVAGDFHRPRVDTERPRKIKIGGYGDLRGET